MSHAQFGYSYPTSSQLLIPGQSPPNCGDPSSGGLSTTSTGSSATGSGGGAESPMAAEQPVCYEPSRFLYPRLATGLAVNSLYPSSYADQSGYVAALGTSSAAFYPSLDNRATWGTIPQAAAACYPYDPALAAYSPYGDRYSAMDSAARRKNATRETTNTLKAWLYEHRKNPYPTKGEKIMLAIITKMTLTQVSTWFANARRRLKKENKMTWEPRNKNNESGEDKADGATSDTDNDCGDKSDSDVQRDVKQELQDPDMESRKVQPSIDQGPNCLDMHDFPRTTQRPSLEAFSAFTGGSGTSTTANSSNSHSVQDGSSDDGSSHLPPQIRRHHPSLRHSTGYHDERSSANSLVIVDSLEGSRPKIWSLAQTATSDSPPGLRKSPCPPLSDRYRFQQRLLNDASVSNASISGYYRDLHTDPSFMSTAQPLSSHLGSEHSNSKPTTSPWINGHSPILQTSSPTGHPDVLNLTPDSSPTSYVIGRSGLGSMSPQAEQTSLTAASGRFSIVEEKESSMLRNEQCIVKPEVNTGEYETASLEMSRSNTRNFCRNQQPAAHTALQGTCLNEAASRLSVHPLYASSGDKHDKVRTTKDGAHRLHPPQSMVSTSSSPPACMSNCTAFKPVPKSDVKSM